MNAPTYINSAHRTLARNPGGLTLDEIAGKIRAKAKKVGEQIRELHDLGMIQTEEEAGQPVYKLVEPAAAAPVCDLVQTEGESQAAPMAISDSEGGEADAPVPLSVVITPDAMADFATTPELQYLAREDYELPPADPALLASANRALGEQLEDAKAENSELSDLNTRLSGLLNAIAVAVRGEPAPLSLHSFHDLPDRVTAAINALKGAMELAAESNDLRARLDAVTQQSIADTDALTQQIERLKAELETARAEAIALKTLEGAMPGFGAEYDAQRIASLTAELQALRTCSANAINEAGRLRAELATERQAREALQEQGDDAVDVKDAAVGYLVRVPKRRPMMRTKPESARAAALSAVRSGAAHAEVLAVVPVGTARRGAEWRGA